MPHFHIRTGAKPSFDDLPDQEVADTVTPGSAAILGSDFPGLKPAFAVKEGDPVAVGQVLFRDRLQPEIGFASSVSGVVKSTSYGPRRTLSICEVEARSGDADAYVSKNVVPKDVRAGLLESGMWPAFRTRPFGRIPDPTDVPDAIFVNACQRTPQSPKPAVVLKGRQDDFHQGVSLLTDLTPGRVFVCQGKEDALPPEHANIVTASFSGSLASGLSGTHIDRLFPLRAGRHVWTIDYQDAAAIGQVFRTGRYDPMRTVSVTGSGVTRPRLVQTALGGAIADVCNGVSSDAAHHSGARFLGRFCDQVSIGRKPAPERKSSFLSNLLTDTRALIPTARLENAIAVDVYPIPLMRALSIGDKQTAQSLGCLALVEEDIAELSRRCTSGADYGALLRDVLDDLRADAA